MKLDAKKWAKELRDDPELAFFVDWFDEPPGSYVVDIGDCESKLCHLLTDSGFRTIGVDIRDCAHQLHGYSHITADFCEIDQNLLSRADVADRYMVPDCIVAVSSLEHFGIGAYGTKPRKDHDRRACWNAWQLLKSGGTFYVVVPFGLVYAVVPGHWRVYDWPCLQERIIGNFEIETVDFRVTEDFEKTHAASNFPLYLGASPSLLCMAKIPAGAPWVSVFLKMRKKT